MKFSMKMQNKFYRHFRHFIKLGLYTGFIGYGLGGMPGYTGEITMMLEEPENSVVYSGVANLRGWAISTDGIDRVELHIDGVYLTNIPVGGSRQDVAAVYPQVPDSANAGFSMALNYSLLAPGNHIFMIRVLDLQGAEKTISVTVPVQRFNTAFIKDATAVNVDAAQFSVQGNTLSIQGLSVNGQPFDVILGWQTGAQSFRINSINP